MAEFDMVNGILLTGNLVIWVALCLRRGESAVWGRMGALRTKAAGAKGAAGTLPHGGGNGAQGDRGIGRGAGNGRLAAPEARFAESLVGFLEFAVYGAGMIRMADLILQGIAGPGGESGALFAVRVLLAESMLLLFPLWRMLHRWKAEEDGAGMRGAWDGCWVNGGIPSAGKPWGEKRPDWNRPGTMGAAAGFWQGWRDALLEEGQGILGMLLLLGLTLRGWREQDLVRAFGAQAWMLLLFFCYGYLGRRRGMRDLAGLCGEAGAGAMESWAQGWGGSVMGPPEGYGGSATGIPAGGYGRNAMESPMQGRGGKGDRGMPGDSAGNADRARQMEYLRNVEEQYQRTRELWHDLKNHIKVLEILAQEERFGELADYLDSFRRDVERRMIPARTGCAPVDALLGDKLYLAGRQGTELSLQLCQLSQTGIEAVDFCVILGNLLDNALEACARLDGQGRIGLRMRREEEFYYITVVNTSVEPRREGISYVSGKRGRDNGVGHGLGLRSAERLAHRYGGLLATDYSEGEFRVVVRLQDVGR